MDAVAVVLLAEDQFAPVGVVVAAIPPHHLVIPREWQRLEHRGTLQVTSTTYPVLATKGVTPVYQVVAAAKVP